MLLKIFLQLFKDVYNKNPNLRAFRTNFRHIINFNLNSVICKNANCKEDKDQCLNVTLDMHEVKSVDLPTINKSEDFQSCGISCVTRYFLKKIKQKHM